MAFSLSGRRAFTLVEAAAVILVLSLLVAMIISVALARREDQRREQCVDNLRQIGQALHNHHDARCHFPASSCTTLDENRTLGQPDTPGFSWLVRLLPFVERKELYNQLVFTDKTPFALKSHSDTRPSSAHLAATVIPTYRCPSFSGSPFGLAYDVPAEGDETPRRVAGSNYVALSASTKIRLFGDPARGIEAEPDGTLYPKSRSRFRDMTDGSSHTLIVCETREVHFSSWIDGNVASVFALQPLSLGAEESDYKRQNPGNYLNVSAEAIAQGARTTINFRRTSDDEMYFPGVYGTSADRPAGGWRWGPSSEHNGVVNHLFGDGTVRGIREDVDPNIYFHLVTARGSDPLWADCSFDDPSLIRFR